MDDEHCYRAASSRDGRFDGTFVTAVLTTGIYCRPSCPAMTPKRQNVRFYATPAAAQEAGFRACKRCRPDAAPGSPEWDTRADLVARAVRLIGDGVVEREGVGGLSARLSYSSRQLHRLMTTELGTGPLRLATAHRVQNARALLENTDLAVTDVAWAAGFGSVRQFNDRVREVFALTPSEIRARRPSGRGDRSGVGRRAPVVVAQLTYRPPLDLAGILSFLGRRAVPGVEWWDGSSFKRVLDLPHGAGLASIDLRGPGENEGRSRRATHPAVSCTLRLEDVRDYSTAVSRLRRLLDLDADPNAVTAALGGDRVLGGLVAENPGRRPPGTVAPFEQAVRAILGQQVSLASARIAASRMTVRFGAPVDLPPIAVPAGPEGTAPPLYRFPRPETLAEAAPGDLPLPGRRAATVIALARAVSTGRLTLDPGADRDETHRRLLELPGIGPWTASYVRMRALGDPDVFLPRDLVLDRLLTQLGGRPDDVTAWKPWRSYAVAQLWGAAAEPVNRGPTTEPMPAKESI